MCGGKRFINQGSLHIRKTLCVNNLVLLEIYVCYYDCLYVSSMFIA